MQTKNDLYDRRNNRSPETESNEGHEFTPRGEARRETSRLQLRLWTEGRTEGRLDFHNCSNLSESGIFIETTSPYPLHAMVDIEFNLPGVQDPIRVKGRVVSVLDDGNAGASIMGNGFSFEHLAPAERNLLATFVRASSMAGF